jgi:positive regulator of sigma E activity
MPLLFFLLGYALAALAGAGEGIRILVSFAALLVSAVVLVLSQRRKNDKKPITFDIIA